MTIAEVADLLERAALALRGHDAGTLKLDVADTSPRLDTLAGYETLSTRLRKVLRFPRGYKNGKPIWTVRDLCALSIDNLLGVNGFGVVCLEELQLFMDKHGLRLKDD